MICRCRAHRNLLTRLRYAKKAEVNLANMVKLDQLPGIEYVYHAIDEGDIDTLETVTAPPELRLRVGAQVIYLKNRTQSMFNGVVGRVVAFQDVEHHSLTFDSLPVVRFELPLQEGEWEEILVHPEEFTFEIPGGGTAARRTQVSSHRGIFDRCTDT
jgi:hypothetical protein